MSKAIEIKVHEIATDGLPKMGELTGCVAFIFDGCIVSGWPLTPEEYFGGNDTVVASHHERGDTLWEADSDVGNSGRMFANVTHWVEFPKPIWQVH